MLKKILFIAILIIGINHTMTGQIFGCYGSTGHSLTSSNTIIQTSPNFIYNITLEWDFDISIFPFENSSSRSYIEIREYISSEFCIDGTTDSGIFGQYEFNIGYVPTNSSGIITLTFNQDFFKKCFEWRVVTENTFINNQNCITVTEWQYHSIFD